MYNCVWYVPPQVSIVAKECVKSVLSQHQKFNKAHMVVQDLATLASEVGMAEFEERLSILNQVREVWRAGRNATLQVLDDDGSTEKQPDQPCLTAEQPLTSEQMATTSKQLEKEPLSCAGKTLAPKQSDQVWELEPLSVVERLSLSLQTFTNVFYTESSIHPY